MLENLFQNQIFMIKNNLISLLKTSKFDGLTLLFDILASNIFKYVSFDTRSEDKLNLLDKVI